MRGERVRVCARWRQVVVVEGRGRGQRLRLVVRGRPHIEGDSWPREEVEWVGG